MDLRASWPVSCRTYSAGWAEIRVPSKTEEGARVVTGKILCAENPDVNSWRGEGAWISELSPVEGTGLRFAGSGFVVHGAMAQETVAELLVPA